MAEVAPTPFKQRIQMAGVIAGAVLTFNTLFWVVSNFYFQDKTAVDQASANAVRLAFGTLSLVVAGAAYAAAIAPRLIGHGLAFLMGLFALVGGVAALAKDMPQVLGVTLLGIGVLMPVLAWRSLRHSRAAWSFLIAFVAVFGIVDFFGAPKIRTLLGIGIWHALIIPGLQIVTVIALSMLRGEYRERG